MTTNQKLIFIFLILGLLLSSIIRIKFNLSNGFEYHGFWIRLLPFPIFDYAGGSNELKLTSTVLGYLFFLISGILMLKYPKRVMLWVSMLIVVVLVSILFETTYILQDLNQKFVGQHLRVGPFLFILGIILFYDDKIKLRKNG